MPFLNIAVALYDYEANFEDELTIKRNDVLYILEDDDPNWWKAKLKVADPNHPHVGLVPSNCVKPLPPVGTVLGLYSYEAATEELTFEQGDTLTLYEQDNPDWLLVSPVYKGHSRKHQAEEGDQREGPTPPTVRAHGDKDDIQLWAVKEIDKEIGKEEKKRKKKKKGRLAVSNMSIFFGSEEDKSPVRQWLTKDVINVRHEKSHVYLYLGGAPPSSLDFKAASKREAVAIFYKIQKIQALENALVTGMTKGNRALVTRVETAMTNRLEALGTKVDNAVINRIQVLETNVDTTAMMDRIQALEKTVHAMDEKIKV
ncbi:MAG: hypothetical protein J3Q66DRAFT_418397 [Benniella sp.]|nr:MAG: hypothetical protein J3Q66DRAFT_418397 [Benniella sp.]